MAEASPTLERHREEARTAVAEFMARRPETVAVDGTGLRRREIAGWRTTVSVAGRPIPVRIALDVDFPFSAPRFYLEGGPFFLRYPHIDESEKLCLSPGTATHSPARPVEVLTAAIADAEGLLGECFSEKNRDDFIHEFRNYWIEFRKNEENPIWSLLQRYDQTRLIHYWSGQNFCLVAESAAQLTEWLDRLFPGGTEKKRTIHETVFVALPKPLFPEDYPRTNGDFRQLALAADARVDELLARVTPQESRSLCVVFGFAGANGTVLGGLRLSDPVAPTRSNWTKPRPVKGDGFRPGRIPPEQLVSRYFGNTKAVPLVVDRVDPGWLLHRGGAGFDQALAGKSVGIVGCGSLGADLAVQLAKSGVGRLFLVDSQAYAWDNVGRHILSGRFAGVAKDKALKQFLGEQMPSVTVETGGGWTAQQVVREKPAFGELDLIVSTTGDWATESYLNAVARTARIFPPVVFGWTEPFGLAGHALAVVPRGGCLACGCTETGIFEHRVADWPAGHTTFTQATGCSDLFQPFGTVDVAPIRSMIAEVGLRVLRREVHRSTLWTWIGDTARMTMLGATLRKAWRARLPSDRGWSRLESDWEGAAACPLCRR